LGGFFIPSRLVLLASYIKHKLPVEYSRNLKGDLNESY